MSVTVSAQPSVFRAMAASATRIAGSLRQQPVGNSAAGHLLYDLQELQDGRSAFRPKVERNNAPVTVAEIVERTDMGVGKIANMAVVPDRTAVRRWEIRAVDIETWNPAIHRHEQKRNGVCFGIVQLSDLSIGVGPRGVEIAQRDRGDVVGSAIVRVRPRYV